MPFLFFPECRSFIHTQAAFLAHWLILLLFFSRMVPSLNPPYGFLSCPVHFHHRFRRRSRESIFGCSFPFFQSRGCKGPRPISFLRPTNWVSRSLGIRFIPMVLSKAVPRELQKRREPWYPTDEFSLSHWSLFLAFFRTDSAFL